MTKKDYIETAAILREFKEGYPNSADRAIDHVWLTEKFAKMFKQDNSNFNTRLFYSAAGVLRDGENTSPDTYDDQQQEHEEETRKEYDNALGQTRN